MLKFLVVYNSTTEQFEIEAVYNTDSTALEVEGLKRFAERAQNVLNKVVATSTANSITGQTTVNLKVEVA